MLRAAPHIPNSLTLTDALGLQIGCFIRDSSNRDVASLIIDTGAASLDASSSGVSGAPLAGGTMDIIFDPVSGTASANVQSILTTTTDTFTQADLAGSWKMTCSSRYVTDSSDDIICRKFLVDAMDSSADAPTDASMDIFLDVVSGTNSTETLHLMAVWPSAATYTHCGQTEGLQAPPPEEGFIEIISTGIGDASGDPIGTFSGILSDVTTDIQYHLITAENLKTYLTNNGLPYDASITNNSQCLPMSDASMDFSMRQMRECYLKFYEEIHKVAEASSDALCLPRLTEGDWNWQNFVGQSDASYDTSGIKFEEAMGGIDIRSRMALMPLYFSGSSAVATDYRENSWTKTDGTSDIVCTNVNEMSIVFAEGGTASGADAVGSFTVNESKSCGEYDQSTDSYGPPTGRHDVFEIEMNRP